MPSSLTARCRQSAKPWRGSGRSGGASSGSRRVDSFYHDNRLQAGGRSYAPQRLGSSLEISYGMGLRPRRCKVIVAPRIAVENHVEPNLQRFEWDNAFAAPGGNKRFTRRNCWQAKCPADIEDVFKSVNLSLFPRSPKDITFECTLPPIMAIPANMQQQFILSAG